MSAPRGGRGQSAAKRRTPPTSDRPDPKRRQVVQDAEGHENNPPSGSPRPGPKAVTDTVSAGAQDSNQAPAPAASEQERTQPDGDVLDDDSSLHEFCLQRDRIIVRSWNKLDRIISRYVEAVLVDNLPFDNLNPTSFPYAMLMRLSENPAAVSTNPLYAKYLFQSSIWNMLDKFFFSQTATEWACEQEGAGDYDDRNRTRGLAKSLSLLTYDFAIRDDVSMTPETRDRFYNWQAETIDFIQNTIVDDQLRMQQAQEVVHSILTVYAGLFKLELGAHATAAWDELVYRTLFVVASAADVAEEMRSSTMGDGLWMPFHPTPRSKALPEAVMAHKDSSLFQPSGRVPTAESMVTLTVVPGLVKIQPEVKRRDVMGEATGSLESVIRRRTKLRARCFIDLSEEVVRATSEDPESEWEYSPGRPMKM